MIDGRHNKQWGWFADLQQEKGINVLPKDERKQKTMIVIINKNGAGLNYAVDGNEGRPIVGNAGDAITVADWYGLDLVNTGLADLPEVLEQKSDDAAAHARATHEQAVLAAGKDEDAIEAADAALGEALTELLENAVAEVETTVVEDDDDDGGEEVTP